MSSNSSVNISVGSFNVGAGWFDYEEMLKASSTEFEKMNRLLADCKNEEQGVAKRWELQDAVETLAANRLGELDVICLQEVKRLGRAFITTLKSIGFEIYCIDKNSRHIDTAIAIKSARFEANPEECHITSASHEQEIGYGQEIACVVAKIKDLGIPLALQSLHNWGFQLYAPDYKSYKIYNEHDKEQSSYAYDYTQEAIDNVESRYRGFSVVGGDLNNNPDNFKPPFDLMDAAGYQTLTPDVATNVNRGDPDYMHRTIDFLFAGEGSWLYRTINLIKSIFVSTPKFSVDAAKVVPDFSFTVGQCCSDHLPIYTTLKIEMVPSKISQIWNSIFSQ